MADSLRDLLQLEDGSAEVKSGYLEHLAGQSIDSLRSQEPKELAQTSHALLRSVQALSRRSHKAIVESAIGHATLRETIPSLASRTSELDDNVPKLDAQAEHFSAMFSKSGESEMLASRKNSLRLLENSERLVELMELPSLLLSAVSATPLGYSSALDLFSHIRRLASLYSDSKLVSSVLSEAEDALHLLAMDLLAALKAPGLKLAAALRTVGWLKRTMPHLIPEMPTEESLQAVFLICRFANLLATLEALDPLRQLADDERAKQAKNSQGWAGGQQTERYLKRFIEVFREHSFNIISISKNVGASTQPSSNTDPLSSAPAALATFPMHLVRILMETLDTYLPIVKDQTSRESILTQVLYCAGSLGRLGADFSLLLAMANVNEWVEVVKRHRQLAGRLESVIGDFRSAPTEAAA